VFRLCSFLSVASRTALGSVRPDESVLSNYNRPITFYVRTPAIMRCSKWCSGNREFANVALVLDGFCAVKWLNKKSFYRIVRFVLYTL